MFQQIPPVIKNIIIINVLVFLGSQVIDWMNLYFTGFYYLSPNFRPWQIVTHMFMHGGFAHIFFNMYALFIFGTALERYWGSRRMIIYYFVCGLGAFFLHMFINFLEIQPLLASLPNELARDVIENGFEVLNTNRRYVDVDAQKLCVAIHTGVVGASGAVFGVLLAFGVLFPETQLMLLFPPVTLKAKWLVVIYGAIEIFLGIQNYQWDNVAHFAHIGGMLFGYLTLKIWQRQDRVY